MAFDGSNRNTRGRRGFRMAHPVQEAEHDDGTTIRRQALHGPLDIQSLPAWHSRGSGVGRAGLSQVTPTRLFSGVIRMGPVSNTQQPRSRFIR